MKTSNLNLRFAPPAFAVKCALLALFGVSLLAPTAFAKAVGTVKSVTGNSIVLTTDSGEVTVTLADSTRILRASPGQTDLKSATPIQASDIHVGDRLLAIGPTGEGNSVTASTVIVMTQGDIAARHSKNARNGAKASAEL